MAHPSGAVHRIGRVYRLCLGPYSPRVATENPRGWEPDLDIAIGQVGVYEGTAGAGEGKMAENPIEYRRNAEDCRHQASRAVRNEDKARWLKLAEDWLNLAKMAD